MKNCVSLSDFIHPEQLESACICATHIEEEKLSALLRANSRDIPIYIARELEYDSQINEARNELQRYCGSSDDPHPATVSTEELADFLHVWHQKKYGEHWRTYYSRNGTQFSNILLLVYPPFLRIVITSSLHIDTDQADNHWYIHDLPRLKSPGPHNFESRLLCHVKRLGIPEKFIATIRRKYDYSKVKVHLLASTTLDPYDGGLDRLSVLVRQMRLNLNKKSARGEFQLEVCAYRIENFLPEWLSSFYRCALGNSKLDRFLDTPDVSKIRLFYPTHDYAVDSPQNGSFAGTNMYCPPANSFKGSILHRYESKDRYELSTQNLILAYNPKDSQRAPYYAYIGSADFTISAWGEPVRSAPGRVFSRTQATYGVFIPGDLIKELLKEGTRSWEDGIVPYNRTAGLYDSDDNTWRNLSDSEAESGGSNSS
ncbi:hypothetical protein O1611_g9937 [Lasiodiplodia mahajangana]|uniref:Uncharacterized protein n=1 Tax=Lasiodiplodia mahajangana TaxID=1108764 RepID=A0ACC2J3T4_9PEZI|nr:hypothetical protein O1611_g9937 [Lasiodiplodia mahajangana]